MFRYDKRFVFVLLALIAAFFLISPQLPAEDHVVSAAQLHEVLQSAVAARQNNIAQIENFFSSPPVKQALKHSGLSLRQVQQAVPALSDQELAELSKRTQKIRNDFAAGALSNERLTYIVIALATAVIVILILKA